METRTARLLSLPPAPCRAAEFICLLRLFLIQVGKALSIPGAREERTVNISAVSVAGQCNSSFVYGVPKAAVVRT